MYSRSRGQRVADT